MPWARCLCHRTNALSLSSLLSLMVNTRPSTQHPFLVLIWGSQQSVSLRIQQRNAWTQKGKLNHLAFSAILEMTTTSLGLFKASSFVVKV